MTEPGKQCGKTHTTVPWDQDTRGRGDWASDVISQRGRELMRGGIDVRAGSYASLHYHHK